METLLLSRSPHPAATDDILDSAYSNKKQHAALKGSELMRTGAVGRVDLHTVVYLQNPYDIYRRRQKLLYIKERTRILIIQLRGCRQEEDQTGTSLLV